MESLVQSLRAFLSLNGYDGIVNNVSGTVEMQPVGDLLGMYEYVTTENVYILNKIDSISHPYGYYPEYDRELKKVIFLPHQGPVSGVSRGSASCISLANFYADCGD
jgi:hypothetical protein